MAQVKFVTWLAGLVNKSTPTDTDQMYVGDAGTSKYSTWANVKATLKTYFDTLYAKIGLATASGLTSSTARLLGRSTAGTGALEEITLGTNLSFTGSTLNAAGGGGGSPGGATTQVQFNNAGAFGGDPMFTWTAGANPKLIIGTTAGNSIATLQGATGIGGLLELAANNLDIRLAGTQLTRADNNAFNYGNNFRVLQWGPSGIGFANDVGLGFNSTGTLGIQNASSTSTAYRDLILRNLRGTGNLSTGIALKTTAYTATVNDGSISADATTAALVITLFPAAGNSGKLLFVKRLSSGPNDVTIDGNASELIDGALTVILNSQYDGVTLQVNTAGTGWNKLSGVAI